MLVAALVLASCVRRAPPPSVDAPPVTGDSYAERIALVDAINARAARIQTMRATFSADVVREGSTRSVTGVLVVAKPDRYRFRLMLPFGVTVFDQVRDGKHTWTLTPLGAPSGAVDGRWLSNTFFAEALDPSHCQFGVERDGILDTTCGRRLYIRTSDATIAAEEFLTGDAQYDDERVVDQVLLPFRIQLTYRGGTSVRVTIDHYEVNPILAPQVFTPPPGAELVAPPSDR
ncbi:MAG: hypothetical protein ABI629_14005 [bacterium]